MCRFWHPQPSALGWHPFPLKSAFCGYTAPQSAAPFLADPCSVQNFSANTPVCSPDFLPSDAVITANRLSMPVKIEILAFPAPANDTFRDDFLRFFLFSGVFRVCKCHHNTFLQISAGKLSPFKYQQFHQGSYCHSPLFSKGSPSTRLICIVPVQFSIAFPSCFCYSVIE